MPCSCLWILRLETSALESFSLTRLRSWVPRRGAKALPGVAPRPARATFLFCDRKVAKRAHPAEGAPARPRGGPESRRLVARSGVAADGHPVLRGSAGHPWPADSLRAPPVAAPPEGGHGRLVASQYRGSEVAPLPIVGDVAKQRAVPGAFTGGRTGRRAQWGCETGRRARVTRTGMSCSPVPPSTTPGPGTCRASGAAGHPCGTMALATLAVTKVARAGRAAELDSAEVPKRGTREHEWVNQGCSRAEAPGAR